MIHIGSRLRGKIFARLALFLSALTLAACDPAALSGPSVGSSGPVKVALLVPAGSGDAQFDQIANDLTNAAKLAVADLDGVTVDLQVYETGRSAQNAAALAQQAVDSGAKIIIGPLDAASANAAALAVRDENVNVLSFSNNPAIAGGNTFILGSTFDNTADRLVRYARGNGKTRFMVVSGRTTAEEAGNAAVTKAVQNRGGSVVSNNFFQMSQEGVVSAVPGLAATATNSGAEAIFLTSSTQDALPLLTQLLPENGVSPEQVQFIGLTRWDIPASALSLPGVQGGWFALPDQNAYQAFRNRYSSTYGNTPHPLAGLAYDGVAAVGALVKTQGNKGLTSAGLTQSNGFAGASGVFRFLENGTNERGLAVATIQNNQVRVIDPAPRRLGSAGS
ncbi:MAG: penicillin-binding protein activator [Mangrovicoccus sp.]|nr:penicillin-binding protein activator [Mangrovicoccus sp.]